MLQDLDDHNDSELHEEVKTQARQTIEYRVADKLYRAVHKRLARNETGGGEDPSNAEDVEESSNDEDLPGLIAVPEDSGDENGIA